MEILTIKNMDYKFINVLKDINNIKYFVWTFSKTGTTSLSKSLQRLHNNSDEYENVLHCHTEDCWHTYFNLESNFSIMDIVKMQKNKPIIFQLYRNPIERLISDYFHVKNCKNYDINDDVNDDLNNYLNYKTDKYYEYYEDKLDFKFSDIKYDKINKFLFIEKDEYYLFFTALEHFSYLKNNLINCFNSRDFCFDNFSITKEHIGSYNKKNIKIKKDIIDKLFENNKEIIEFYYTDEEIENFKNKYTLI